MAEIAQVAWLVSGFAFWVCCLVHEGLPDHIGFALRSREPDGWCDLIFFYLPLAIVGGPFWWLLYLYLHVRSKADG